jgi:hypothetical protein
MESQSCQLMDIDQLITIHELKRRMSSERGKWRPVVIFNYQSLGMYINKLI